jgi:hypothetical protein
MKSIRTLAGLVALAATTAGAHAATYDSATDSSLGSPFFRYDAGHIGSISPVLPLPGLPANPYFGTGYSPTDEVNGLGPYFSGTSDSSKYTFWYIDTLSLNAAVGFEISATMKVGTSTVSGNRAGVALALTDSANNYTELYLTPTGIFLNGPGRTHVGDATDTFGIDTTAEYHDYTLKVLGSTVTVLVDGDVKLTGTTYTVSVPEAPTLPSWAAFGDITQAAGGSYYLDQVTVSVPEPTIVSSLCVAGGIFLLRRRKSALPH